MSFAIDPTYYQTDAKQMLMGYDFSELNLQAAKDAKDEQAAAKTKAATELGVKPKVAENDAQKSDAEGSKDNGDDTDDSESGDNNDAPSDAQDDDADGGSSDDDDNSASQNDGNDEASVNNDVWARIVKEGLK